MAARSDAYLNRERRWQFGWCEYFELSRQLLVHGVPARIESKVLQLLQYLLERAPSGKVAPKKEILLALWGPNVSDQTLPTAMSKLRTTLGGPRHALILSAAGGYRMAVPVLCTEEVSSHSAPFALRNGDAMPRRTQWFAKELLGGEGGDAVWLAENRMTHELRVFKFAREGVRLRALRREVTLSRLFQIALGEKATSFVRILDSSFSDAPFFIESEYGGLNLLEFAATGDFACLDLRERVALAADLAEAVSAAHALGALHNDLKPANLLISPKSNTRTDAEILSRPAWQIKVADFGVGSFHDPRRLLELQITHHESLHASDEETRTTPGGTAIYRAPELSRNPATTAKGDVYALGVILYQLVSGQFQEPPSPGWEARVPDPLLRQDIADAANVDPAMRLGSAADLARRLRTLQERRAEALQRAEEVERVRRAEAAIEPTRLRRPWIATATTALILALGVSLWLNHLANQQRRFAEKELRAQTAMLSFLADDLLQQSNPYARPAGSDKGGQQTLLEAIAVAAPRIEVRFAQQPEVAAQLHETIGDVLRRRTRFPEADREYALAAERYREVEGPLSQDAQVVELKRVGAELSGRLPGFMDRAKTNFARQQELSAKLKPPVRAKLRAWQAYTEAAFLGTGPNPESALPKLDEAARIAETDPELKRSMSTDIKLRSGGIYVFENDGVNLERVAREVIASETQLRGLQSTYILPAQMYLQEAFYSEGKYQAAIEQGKRNRQKFLEVLSSDHQLTLGTLATKAAAEAQLEQYSDAVEDDLELNRDSVGLPSGARMAAGALHDAALFECHMGRFQAGIEHARQVLAKWGSGPQAQPVFAEGSKHVIAECIIGEQESKASRPDEKRLREADGLLRSLNLPLVAQAVGNHDLEQSVDLDRGRLFLLRGEYAQSGEIVAKLAPAMHKNVVDTYDKRQFVRLNQALAAHGAAAAP